MEIFARDRWRIDRMFGRNPLLRRADRVEALVMLVVLVAALVAIPVAGVVGVVAYGVRDRVYTQEAHERHRVMATVVDIWVEDLGVAIVQAKWPAADGDRSGPLQLTDHVTTGGNVEVWVDRDGNPVAPPTPIWLAAAEALGVAAVALLAVWAGIVAVVVVIRARIDRARDAAWDREIRCLADAS